MKVTVVQQFDYEAHEAYIRDSYKPMKLRGLAGVKRLQAQAVEVLVTAGRNYRDTLHVWPKIHEAGNYYTIHFTETRSFSLEAYLTAIGDLRLIAVHNHHPDYRMIVEKPKKED